MDGLKGIISKKLFGKKKMVKGKKSAKSTKPEPQAPKGVAVGKKFKF